ncbi:FabD/lysophospholipase-like protein [Meredithblackwellia eburnea MCA 4105]
MHRPSALRFLPRSVHHLRHSTTNKLVLACGCLVGVGTVAGAAAAIGLGTGSRPFTTKRSLLCEEEKKGDTKSKNSRSIFDLPLPPLSLDLPTFSDLKTKATTDLNTTLVSLSTSLVSLRTALLTFQEEVTRGPESTYTRVTSSRSNESLHPEMGWDATVRLGTELGTAERAFIRTRREAMRDSFAKVVGVGLEEVDVRDLPVVSIAGSGGGYRAMVNTLGSIEAAKETGVWDLVSFVSAVSGSCWAVNLLYSVGEGDVENTLEHVKKRIVTPFLDPSTIDLLTKDETREHLLSGVFLKESSKGGEVSLVDVYGTLVSSRLYIPENLDKLSASHLKVSSQRKYIGDGSNPLPIYCMIRHENSHSKEMEQQNKKIREGATKKIREEGKEEKEKLMKDSKWMWFELSPMEFGSDELGAWIPTWALGRQFDGGKNVERQPEMSLTILSGIFASAFCATLYSYYKEVKPLLSTLPYFTTLEKWLLTNYEHDMDSFHPVTPAELPSFLKGISGLRSTAPKDITTHETLGFMDAGANLNLPYVPLFRRDADLIIALDASADSQALWFDRASEYAVARELRTWPRVRDAESLFEKVKPAVEDEGKSRSPSEKAASKVDEAKAQEREANPTDHPPHQKLEVNPDPPPVGSAPRSARSVVNDGEGVVAEPPLGKCNIWIGSSDEEAEMNCRNDNPTVEDVMKRDGICLAYFPLTGGPALENPGEVWSTWRFDYPEEETAKLAQLAKDNFKSGEKELKTLIKGIWMRKRKQRLAEEAQLTKTSSSESD